MSQTARALSMYEVYLDGASLEEVGQEFGLTRERIRQIFKEAQLDLVSMRDRQAKRAERLSSEIVTRFRETRDEKAIAAELRLPKYLVNEIVRREVPRSVRSKKRSGSPLYSDEELREMLREANREIGGVLSKKDYERYASGRTCEDGRRWPTGQTPMHRFGSWRNALRAAGLGSNPTSAISGQLLFDEAQCIDALRFAARELGCSPSVNSYADLARSQAGGLPSVATIRNRLGKWSEALERAGV